MGSWKLYVLWAVLLVFQNASFTMVSRARNSGSDWYHAIAAVFSNGIWFGAYFITFERVWTVLETASLELGVLVGAIYIASTVFGSVVMGKFLRRYVETGKRQVGHYEENEKRIDSLEKRIHSLDGTQSRYKHLEERVGALRSAVDNLKSAVQGVGDLLREGVERARAQTEDPPVPSNRDRGLI